MNKEFIPYTEALALKELGFDEPCFAIWSGIDELNFSITDTIRLYSSEFRIDGNQSSKFYVNDFNSLRVAAPTFSQAFRWFREKYEIEATTACFYNKRLDIPYEERQYHCHIIRDGVTSKGPKYKTYEEAELACLEKLIEIVENIK